jgi:hypothetical protein
VLSVAAIRPDDWNFPLLMHVLGAMLLVGALVLAGSALVLAWRGASPIMLRLGFRALLFGALPAWIVMRAGAQSIADKESLTDSDLSWIGIGFGTADSGVVLILVSSLLAGLALRRANRSAGAGGGFSRPAAILVAVMVVAYVVTIWAMTAKPT